MIEPNTTPDPRAIALEICVDTPAGPAIAAAAGADRVELCSALALGGLTPSAGLVETALDARLPVHAMIRPRPGGFVHRAADAQAMLADIAALRGSGVSGFVLGAATPRGTLDTDLLARCAEAARGLPLTLHRVIDTLPDPVAALEQAIDLGFARVLTSGGARTAPEGVEAIARLVRAAAGRIEVMAGGGVTPEAAPKLISAGVDALHASCTAPAGAADPMGFGADRAPDPARIAALKATLTSRDLAPCA